MKYLGHYKAGDEMGAISARINAVCKLEALRTVVYVGTVGYDNTTYIMGYDDDTSTVAETMVDLEIGDDGYAMHVDDAVDIVAEIQEIQDMDKKEAIRFVADCTDGEIVESLAHTRPEAEIAETIDQIQNARRVVDDLVPVNVESRQEYIADALSVPMPILYTTTGRG